MSTLALDENGDLLPGAQLLRGIAAVAQDVKQRLRLFRGDWEFDLSAGVPYYEEILGKRYIEHTAQVIRDEILRVQDVTEALVEVELEADRVLLVTPVVYTDQGRVDLPPMRIAPRQTPEAQ